MVADRALRGEQGPWENYRTSLGQLIDDLKLLRKLAADEEAPKRQRKMQEDSLRVKRLPTPSDLNAAVREAFEVVKSIRSFYQDKDTMPARARGAVNTATFGAIWCGGFGGRKEEWETLPRFHVVEQLAAGRDWLVVANHKTASTYGSIAKWLSPGVVECL